MVLDAPGEPLRLADLPEPVAGDGRLLLRVRACGVCRTDLHVVDGELDRPKLPLVPGHQIVAEVVATGERVGVPWLGWTCGDCGYCRAGRENLCDRALFTGYDLDGGYAELAVADERYCFPLPDGYPDLQAAPLLCAGLIGQRALRMTGDAEVVGLYGFGSAAHIVCQVAVWQGRRVHALTRRGDHGSQAFALSLGAASAAAVEDGPPEPLDAARVVCAGIHMSDIPSFPYALLWGERAVRSVANLTRADGEEFLALAPRVPVHTTVTAYPLAAANEALAALREGTLQGSAVIVP